MVRLRAGGLALTAVAGILAAAAPAQAALTRFGLANRCFSVRSSSFGGRFYMKPTRLGSYMLYDRRRRLLTSAADGSISRGTAPGPFAEWAARRAGRNTFLLTAPATGAKFTARVRPARGCRRYPEAAVGAKGRLTGRRKNGQVFGYADAHLHITADMRAGGRVIYGPAFDRFGVTEALGHDADYHGDDGSMDVTGNLLRSGSPTGTHDTHGWPTFAGWPTFDTYTHQQVYYTWLKRAYMAGMRLMTAQLVEDHAICTIEPPPRAHSCDETETIELEAQRLRELQDYVDAQSGGPGRGWFRIVYTPRQARRVIARGKLAVVIGVEASGPFGCGEREGLPQCSEADVDRGIALYRKLGIRSMFIAHWIDNAFAGAALEEGDKGTFIGTFEVTDTGHPFATGPCPEEGQGEECNAKGLTELGAYLVNKLIDNHMLIEMDHLSERARLQVLDIAESRHYPLVSSHTNTGGIWTPSDLKRLYALGGYATARPDTAAKLAKSILSFRSYRRKDQLLGVGLGTDTGGFSAAPEPDQSAKDKPLRYPFRSYDGKVRFVCQLAGTQKFDFNKFGVANYGLYADLLAYMRSQVGGKAASRLLFRSAEAYLRTWERATR